MAMFENFPYTDMHNLNLDWIIKIAKDFLDQYTHIQQLIADGEQSLQDLTASGLEQLQDKADALEAALNAWYNEHSEDIANQLADALSDLNAWYNEHSEDIVDQLADALSDLNAWYTEHSEDIAEELEDAITDFNTRAEQKAADVISTIPSDYSDTSAKAQYAFNAVHYDDVIESTTATALPVGVAEFFLDADIGAGVTNLVIDRVWVASDLHSIRLQFDLDGTHITNYGIDSRNGGSGIEFIDDPYLAVLVNWDALSATVTGFTAAIKTAFAVRNHKYLIYLLRHSETPLNGCVANVVNNLSLSKFFLDAKIGSGVTNVVITGIFKIQSTQYVRVNFRLDGTQITSYGVESRNGGSGLEYIKDQYLSLYVNWDAFPTGQQEGLTLSILAPFNTDHKGFIYCFEEIENDNIKYDYDSFYVDNGKLLARANHRRNRLCAKYFQVDIGSMIKKIMCRFICKSQYGTVMLITTNNNEYGHISDITHGSNHSGFTPYGYMHFGFYGTPETNVIVNFNTPLVDGQEYTLGYEFMGNDNIKAYLPDGTTQIVNVPGIDAVNGRYFIGEYFYDGFPTNTSLNTDNIEWTPQITGLRVEGVNGYAYQDNFQRPNSALSVSPSGHVYTVFRNTAPGDTQFDVTD